MVSRQAQIVVIVVLSALIVAVVALGVVMATRTGQRAEDVVEPKATPVVAYHYDSDAGLAPAVDAPPADAYVPTAEDIAKKKRDDAVTAKRDAIRGALEKASDRRHAKASVRTQDKTLVFDADVDHCNGRLLIELRNELVAAKLDPASQFDRLNCGEMGDEIDLHTKNGCPADLHDQLIISEEGVKRSKLADDMGELVRATDNGYVLSALGCDATVLAITLMSGGGGACDLGAFDHADDGLALFHHLPDPGRLTIAGTVG